ncbi:hypothetical protein AWM68_04655 [Fictibacillus phosphorivorans]|uniref:DUF2642 domain-containing protein n=1 Tax=Fictibacillus phosphorivorans TaxID=1221500 RepID=A0A163RM70_9BACL|nr:hypothetical protein [Fictibacillus phosphorivorans]KZE67152.1 hypothetical protein AWM68_04655 [Fictibacillus phosphorivorans]
MNDFKHLLNKNVKLKVAGHLLEGRFCDFGNDILVLYRESKYLYIPLTHVQKIILSDKAVIEDNSLSPDLPFAKENHTFFSYRMMLRNAIGLYTQIRVVGKNPLHGTIVNVLSDYFVFYSPVYKQIFIPLSHLKWLTVYEQDNSHYSMYNPIPQKQSFSRSFEEQLKKWEGKLIVFDMGEDPDKIGILNSIKGNLAELISTTGEKVYFKLNHAKTVYLA